MFKKRDEDLRVGRRIKSSIVTTLGTAEGALNLVESTVDMLNDELLDLKVDRRTEILEKIAASNERLKKAGYKEGINAYL